MKILHLTTFDEGFEPYPDEEHLLVPVGWAPVWMPGDKPGPVRPEIQPEIRSQGDRGMRSGEHGVKLAHAWAWFDAALIMQFASSPGRQYQANVYATAESGGGLACRIGIDPTAGKLLTSETVHWSEWYGTDDDDFKPYTWKQVQVEVEAAGDQVTVFLRCACRDAVQVNAGFFDDFQFLGEEHYPPPDNGLLDLIDTLGDDLVNLRRYVTDEKRECVLL